MPTRRKPELSRELRCTHRYTEVAVGRARARARIAGVATGTNSDDLLTAIRSLPLPDRSRLVERVVHEAAEQSEGANRSQHSPILGLFADEPGLMDEVCESAMESRERDPAEA